MSNKASLRNAEIVHEYLNTPKSLAQIAKEYAVSSQRVQQIIKNSCLNSLNLSSPKELREKVKGEAVLLREKGSLNLAENLFLQVLAWDKKHNNLRGYIDVIGHLRIVYTLLARKARNAHTQKRYLGKAQEVLEKGFSIKKGVSAESKNILKVHYASVLFSLSLHTKKTSERKTLLNKAETALKTALRNFPGSKAHLSWPLGKLAKIQYTLKKYDEAFGNASLAEKYIYEDYSKEFSSVEGESLIKFIVWLSKAVLIKALVCKDTKRPLLAKYYAKSVLSLPCPAYILHDVRREARKILSALS